MYQSTVPQFIKILGNVNSWLDKAEKYAAAKKFDVKVLLNARLAPDMYHFIKQVQVICDNAKGCAARLAGQEPPKHEDNEQTIDELRQRIHKTVTYLKTLKPEQFKDADKRKITLPWKEGKYLPGGEYLVEMGLPNFYFHAVTAYDILRHNGVDVGKMDFVGELKFKDL